MQTDYRRSYATTDSIVAKLLQDGVNVTYVTARKEMAEAAHRRILALLPDPTVVYMNGRRLELGSASCVFVCAGLRGAGVEHTPVVVLEDPGFLEGSDPKSFEELQMIAAPDSENNACTIHACPTWS